MLDGIRAKDEARYYAFIRMRIIRRKADEIGVGALQACEKATMSSAHVMMQLFGVQGSTDRLTAHQIYIEGIEGETMVAKDKAASMKRGPRHT